jgi:hypothetical protein
MDVLHIEILSASSFDRCLSMHLLHILHKELEPIDYLEI